MALPKKTHYPLSKAAEILKCSIDDIIHWAGNGDTKIGFPYFLSDNLFPPTFHDFESQTSKKISNYSGFVFIPPSSLLNAQVTGRCTFEVLNLLDGKHLVFDTLHSFAINGIEINQLFIRDEELEALKSLDNHLEKPLARSERETLLIIIAALVKKDDIDINRLSKTALNIANLTQQLGSPIGQTTIERHLGMIKQAISNRSE